MIYKKFWKKSRIMLQTFFAETCGFRHANFQRFIKKGRGLRVDSWLKDLWLFVRALFARVWTIVSDRHSGFGLMTRDILFC